MREEKERWKWNKKRVEWTARILGQQCALWGSPRWWLIVPWSQHFEDSKGRKIKKENFLYISLSVTFFLQQVHLAIRANEELFGDITHGEQTFLNWLVSTTNLAKLKYWNPEHVSTCIYSDWMLVKNWQCSVPLEFWWIFLKSNRTNSDWMNHGEHDLCMPSEVRTMLCLILPPMLLYMTSCLGCQGDLLEKPKPPSPASTQAQLM